MWPRDSGFITHLQLQRPCKDFHCVWIPIWNTWKGRACLTTMPVFWLNVGEVCSLHQFSSSCFQSRACCRWDFQTQEERIYNTCFLNFRCYDKLFRHHGNLASRICQPCPNTHILHSCPSWEQIKAQCLHVIIIYYQEKGVHAKRWTHQHTYNSWQSY